MGEIAIREMAVEWRVGVTVEERKRPQELVLTIELERDFADAARHDDLARTIDYFALHQRLLRWGRRRQWKLIETTATDIAKLILREFRPEAVTVEVRKFVLPETGCVAAKVRLPKVALP